MASDSLHAFAQHAERHFVAHAEQASHDRLGQHRTLQHKPLSVRRQAQTMQQALQPARIV